MQQCYSVLALLLVFIFGCSQRQPPFPNQQQPLISPSGRYVLTVPIEENRVTPEYYNTSVWKVTISDRDGNLLYMENDSEFVGILNIYWIWDDEDRVWLFNSDTSCIFFWEFVNGEWVKTKWGYGQVQEINRNLSPPLELYPTYVQ